ncbi:MAG: DUF1559 domain-containing protein [Planctomycetaceae bacterium]|nr:DUF1559 domain-containing protein [Planctomycetaceae bacterium]
MSKRTENKENIVGREHAASPQPRSNVACWTALASRLRGRLPLSSFFRTNLLTASSYHTGGVNCVLVDGSVRFISETIGTGNITQLPGRPDYTGAWYQYSGPSTYGHWGALGTIRGGDTAEIP